MTGVLPDMENFDFDTRDLETCACDGSGWISRAWLFGRSPVCTCGAGSWDAPEVFHTVSCDAVPCPLCPLEEL